MHLFEVLAHRIPVLGLHRNTVRRLPVVGPCASTTPERRSQKLISFASTGLFARIASQNGVDEPGSTLPRPRPILPEVVGFKMCWESLLIHEQSSNPMKAYDEASTVIKGLVDGSVSVRPHSLHY